jgi:hypothetical protein
LVDGVNDDLLAQVHLVQHHAQTVTHGPLGVPELIDEQRDEHHRDPGLSRLEEAVVPGVGDEQLQLRMGCNPLVASKQQQSSH